jgi:hypothetical protein
VSRRLPKPSPLFKTYWRFAAERQEIFFRRMNGEDAPWTSDPILATHRFTNAYRASDRVTQYLIRHVAYGPHSDGPTILARVLLFRIFNRIDTWERIVAGVGMPELRDEWFQSCGDVLDAAFARCDRVYSAAYIMPSPSVFGHKRKHRNHLELVRSLASNDVLQMILEAQSFEEVFLLLKAQPSVGDFLAFQWAIDLNYSAELGFSEMDFVVPGPGASDGIRKCFSSLGDYSEADVIRWVTERQESFLSDLDLEFRSLWGRHLQLVDCQNLFCEVDKYCRMRHPEIRTPRARTKIKQRYSADGAVALNYPWYPPKWGLRIEAPQRKAKAAVA